MSDLVGRCRVQIVVGRFSVTGVGYAVALVVLGTLTAGVLLLVCGAVQSLVGRIWKAARAPQFGIVVAILVLGAAWALMAVPALIEQWQLIVYFGLIGFGMALAAVPRLWYLNRRLRYPIANADNHSDIER